MANKRILQIHEIEAEIKPELLRYFPVEEEGYIRVGEAGYVFPPRMTAGLNEIHNMTIRPDDVFTVSYPRSGTTWSQELVWLIANDCDFETAKSTHLTVRYPLLEFTIIQRPEMLKAIQASLKTVGAQPSSLEQQDTAISRRFIKTHLSLSILPPELLDTAKVVYIARDPRDVCVSLYHFCLLTAKISGYVGDFKAFWNLFKRNLLMWTPIFSHVKEAWNKRNHPNMLFIFYEEMLQDMPSVIRRVSNFFGKTCSDEQMQDLCEHLKFDNFSKNKAIHILQNTELLSKGEKFIRKGQSGGWREYFDEQMSQEAERWIRDNLRDTDLRFPQHATEDTTAA